MQDKTTIDPEPKALGGLDFARQIELVQARHVEAHMEEFGETPELRDRARRHCAGADEVKQVIDRRRLRAGYASKQEKTAELVAHLDAVALRTAPRARGAGRPKAQSTRSSARSGDSGDDSDSSEPPERLCACGCREDISHLAPQAKYLNGTHGNRHRQRRKRWLERDWSEDVSPRDPYLSFDGKVTYEMLRRRAEEGCRCNGSFLPDETGVHCVWCGHDRQGRVGGSRVFISARAFVTTPTAVAKLRTTKRNRSRAAKLAAENRRKRELQIAEGQWYRQGKAA
jgi:hypothetical protein